MTPANYPPQHIAIVMDGNGRWAEKRGLPRLIGHKAGGDNIGRVAKIVVDFGIRYLTLYAFSTENWNRPLAEVAGLLDLLTGRIGKESNAFHKENTRLIHIGRLDRLSQRLRKKMEAAVELTKNNTGLTICLAFDYGGRDEITQAARNICEAKIPAEKIDDTLFSQYLYTTGIPDPDLIIRTGGEMRLSNFLLWQAAYAEFYSTPVLWPDFNRDEISKALMTYKGRQRRFGNI